MLKNKPLIDRVIARRLKKKDPLKRIAPRFKSSLLNDFEVSQPFSSKGFESLFTSNIDGVKLQFKYVTLTVNGRYTNK